MNAHENQNFGFDFVDQGNGRYYLEDIEIVSQIYQKLYILCKKYS